MDIFKLSMEVKKMSKVFISGPMSGYPDYNSEAFYEAERMLKEKGYSVFNPAWMKFDNQWKHSEIMAIDIPALGQCDLIYQLPGWSWSKGACMEYEYAKDRGIKALVLGQFEE